MGLMKCPWCGLTVGDGTPRCPHCNKPLNATPGEIAQQRAAQQQPVLKQQASFRQEQTPTPQPHSDKRKKAAPTPAQLKKQGIFWIILGLVLLPIFPFISIFCFVLTAACFSLIKKGKSDDSSKTYPSDNTPVSFEAVGVSHYLDNLRAVGDKSRAFLYNDAKFLEVYPGGKRCYEYYFNNVLGLLMPEPTNKYDKNAIAVILCGALVGYVPAELCSDVAKLLKHGYHARVTVRGGNYKFVYGGKVFTDNKAFHVHVDMSR